MPTFNSYFPTGYQPVQMQQVQPQNNTNSIIWVQGESGAKAYPVAPNMSVLLMDSESSTFYIKTTDNSGMPLPLRTFDYSERGQQSTEKPQASAIVDMDYITREEFERRLDELKIKTKKKKVEIEEEDDD